jgi:hypothetical protein
MGPVRPGWIGAGPSKGLMMVGKPSPPSSRDKVSVHPWALSVNTMTFWLHIGPGFRELGGDAPAPLFLRAPSLEHKMAGPLPLLEPCFLAVMPTALTAYFAGCL